MMLPAAVQPPPMKPAPVEGARKDAEISLIVAYTKKAASQYTDIVKDLIDVAVAQTNCARSTPPTSPCSSSTIPWAPGCPSASPPMRLTRSLAIHHECASTMYSLEHESGHARHDRALDDSSQPFPYGHGFVHGNEWRTMMSYMESCGGCPRRPIWSSRDVKVVGVPARDAETNNTKVIRENAARVAAFHTQLSG
jgi:hypothetical protein